MFHLKNSLKAKNSGSGFESSFKNLKARLNQNPLLFAHFLASFSILIQSARLSQTKSLLASFSPLQILYYRLFHRLFFLFMPQKKACFFGHKSRAFTHRSFFIWLFFLYFFTANLSLKYTSITNASLLLPLNVLITGILSFLILKKALSKLWIQAFL